MAGQDNSAERFRALVLPHLADALRFARWLVGDAGDAEDVVQEACVRALAGIAQQRGGDARPWLLAIVRNTAMTHLRRRRPTIPLDDYIEQGEAAAAEPGDASLAGPEASLIARADAAAVEAAIAALPLAFREAVVLRDVNGLGYRDIAATLGTVMSRLSRGRALLVAALGETR